MPPSGVLGMMDEDAIIEAEIAQQLDQINVDLDDLDDLNEEINVQHHDDIEENQLSEDEEYIPPELIDYVSTIQKQTQAFERELEEVDDLLHHSDLLLNSKHQEPFSNRKILEEAAEIAGENPEEFRRKLLEDLDKDESDTDGNSTGDVITSDEPLQNGDVSDEPGEEKALVLVTENQLFFQEMLKREKEFMDKQQREREERFQTELIEKKKEEEKAVKELEDKRKQIHHQIEKEQRELAQKQMVQKQKLEKEEKERKQEIEKEIKSFQETINKMEAEIQHGKEELNVAMKEEEQKQEQKRQTAATRIQSRFRSYIVRKDYKKILDEKREDRQKKKEELRIKEVEEERERRRKEEEMEKLKKEEEIRKKLEAEEKRKREEEERIQREIEEKKRILEAEERKKKEKQERLQKEEQRRKEEEERKRREEEEERKRREEESRRKREEEERRVQEEEERNRKEEEKKKMEEENRKKEEERIKKEKEMRQKEEVRIKEDEKRQKEEEERLIQENKKKEETEKQRTEKEKKADDYVVPVDRISNFPGNADSHKNLQINEQKIAEEATENVLHKNLEKDMHDRSKHVRKSAEKRLQSKSARKITSEAKMDDLDDLLFGSEENDTDRKFNSTLMAMEGLPEHIDRKRLQWIKDCIPWSKVSNEPWKLKAANKTKKPARRPSSAKKLQLLEEEIITAAAKVETLRQVTTVQLQDLPGCNISTLGQCWGLKYLQMTNCNLIAVEGLQQCKQLQYLDFQDNYIEYVDLKDLGNLTCVNLSKNKLSSVHGFDGCTNVRWLDMSNNRITRIGGLEGLRRLHTLNLSHNQLINTQGLSDTPTLQLLYLSHNHLQELEDIEKLCLLQHLDVSYNNLLKFPNLVNHVLLCNLMLEDNSLTCLQDIQQYWLPLLQTLRLGQNSFEDLVSLEGFHVLQELDLSNNQIIESDVLINCLSKCVYMENLGMSGNPVMEEVDLSSCLLKTFPRLQHLDDHVIRSHDSVLPMKTRNGFEAMCLTQIQIFKNCQQKFDHDLRVAESKVSSDLQTLCDIYFKFCDKAHKLAVDHRYTHEYGEISMAVPSAPSTPKTNRPKSSRARTLQKEEQFMSPKEMFEKALQGGDNKGNKVLRQENNSSVISDKKFIDYDMKSPRKKITADLVGKMLQNGGQRSKYTSAEVKAATIIQARWRGYSARKYLRNHVHKTQSVIDEDDDIDMEVLQELHRAAVIIQSHWRGYSFRSRLMRALELAKFDDDDDDFEFEDVDMGDFNFDETMLDDWRPPDTPQLPTSHAVLGKPPSGKQRSPPSKVPGLSLVDSPQPPQLPRKAWRGMDSPLSDLQPPHRRVPRPPSSLVSGTDTHRSAVSKKEEKLSEEWGFKDSQTAHLMLQRAKKLKYNAARRKKLSKLDPKQRLALFRKLEEGTQMRPVYQPSRKILPRKEYFQARQEEIDRQDYEKSVERKARVNRTFEWIHTQVGDYDVSDSCIQQPVSLKKVYGSDGNLPKLDPEITAGRPVRLVNSPVSMDLQSVDSASIHGDRARSRRLSADTEGSYTTSFPPIKTGSAPSVRPKEKMSWRSPDVNKSVGWGGGKKRTAKR